MYTPSRCASAPVALRKGAPKEWCYGTLRWKYWTGPSVGRTGRVIYHPTMLIHFSPLLKSNMKKTPYNQISNYASGSTVQISLEVSDNASTALPDLKPTVSKEPTFSKEPSVPNTECLNLFCVASAAGDLSKKFECYKKYGLTSYLGACSINLVTCNSYVTKSSNSLDVNLHSKFECPIGGTNWSFASERKLKLPVEYFSEIKAPLGASPLYFKGEQMSQALYNEGMAGTSYLLTVNSIWKEEASSQHTISNDSYISTNKYVASKIFDNDIQFINWEQNSHFQNPEGISESIAFQREKLSAPYGAPSEPSVPNTKYLKALLPSGVKPHLNIFPKQTLRIQVILQDYSSVHNHKLMLLMRIIVLLRDCKLLNMKYLQHSK